MSGWNIYPRPQMVRADWQNLNGEWLVNGRPGKVPQCRSEEQLTYERNFRFTRKNQVVLLHFGAVDQFCKVFINGHEVGTHEGGYLPFSFDISSFIKDGDNNIIVQVIDTLSHDYPYGKQKKDRGGMWYTPVSGIWQTVWLEQVPEKYIRNVKITPGLDYVDFEVDAPGECTIKTSGKFAKTVDGKARIEIEDPRLWSPSDPYLYDVGISFEGDMVCSYFALRTIEIKKYDGICRVFLNGLPIFFHGVLDQGYYKDGIFIPENPEEYIKDIQRMKELGFNTLRKHIKIEPETYYYACDKLGMLVIQDMVNSGDYKFLRDSVRGTLGFGRSDRSGTSGKRKQFWIQHTRDTVAHLYNHPCIVAYTLFNEGWGQFESDAMYDMVKALDPSRLIDSTSGWFAQKKSDFASKHIYFRNKRLGKHKKKPLLVSECGGYAFNAQKQGGKTYGYGKCDSKKELTAKILKMYEKMIIPAMVKGCCGCIYTQLSDIEDEINGLYTYDRTLCKVSKAPMKDLAKKLLG